LCEGWEDEEEEEWVYKGKGIRQGSQLKDRYPNLRDNITISSQSKCRIKEAASATRYDYE
jgi:hypothetical protein